MSVTFEKTSYLQALNKSESLSSEDDIVKSPENGLQFKYGSSDYEKFSKTYSNKGWEYRKVIALPAAVWSASIQVVYHLAKAIFIGIPKAPSDGRLYLKVQIFHILRDFQESWGRLTSLFHDKYGSFHIQESRCQRACYESFLAKSALEPSKKTRETGEKTKKEQEVDLGIPVADLKKKDKVKTSVKKTKKNSQLSSSESLRISQMSETEIYQKFASFSHKDNRQRFSEIEAEEVHEALYKQKINPKTREGSYILELLSDDHFEGLEISRLPDGALEGLFPRYGNHKVNFKRFAKIKASEVHKTLYEAKIKLGSAEGAHVLKLLSDDHFEGLEISRLPDGVLEGLFPHYVFGRDHEVSLQRFAKIKASEVHKALYQGKIKSESILKLLSDDHFEGLEISRLPDGVLEGLFPHYVFGRDHEVSLQRFAKIKASEVHEALYQGRIKSESILKLLSEDHLKGLKISRLSSEVLEKLFPTSHVKPDVVCHRFAIIEAAEVQAALLGNLLHKNQIRLISIQQLKLLDFSLISNAVINILFPLWSVDDLRKEYSYWVRSDKEADGKGVKQFYEKKCVYSENKLQELSIKKKQENDNLLDQLSQDQRTILEPRLYQI